MLLYFFLQKDISCSMFFCGPQEELCDLPMPLALHRRVSPQPTLGMGAGPRRAAGLYSKLSCSGASFLPKDPVGLTQGSQAWSLAFWHLCNCLRFQRGSCPSDPPYNFLVISKFLTLASASYSTRQMDKKLLLVEGCLVWGLNLECAKKWNNFRRVGCSFILRKVDHTGRNSSLEPESRVALDLHNKVAGTWTLPGA